MSAWCPRWTRRLPVSSAGEEFLRKSFPDHWSFLLGELALYSLLVLVLTGVWLTLLDGETTAEVRRTADGGYEEAHTLLSREEAYRILVRDTPRPRAEGTEAWRWFHRHRLRNAPSRWYFGRSVEMPATAWQKRRVAVVRTAPGEVPGEGEES
ncbi:hypothetical protein FB563_6794 [Streptomyces puniciscabiei]|uniref:Uncharacterized protein n=1 Tax=Streptomyces puniciscabiei TaxID=164348 RepID=A0A542TIV0_9ACTN|nr:hypothetical protein [Streptomyces puniciscabiei]TQK86647.1 hypothetical protein FB563_6794 [Streptomyces puniciscabiei]